MHFSQNVVHAFFYNDSEKDIIEAIFCLIERFKKLQPGKASYIETRIKKYCDEHAGSQSYEVLVLKIIEDIDSETWSWSDVARVFWTLNLIDDAASHRLGPVTREMFRERMIKKVGDKFSFITKYEWVTMPLDTVPETSSTLKTTSVTWVDAFLGTVLFLLVRKYLL